jgi:hypothetical protein
VSVPVGEGFTSARVSTRGFEGTCPGCHLEHVWLEIQTIAIGDATDTLGPLCSNCREEHVHTLLLQLPKSQGAKPPSNRMKKISQKQEQRVMKDIGGRVHKASGAAGDKGDGHLRGVVRVEMKYTFADSFRLDRETLDKIRSECRDKEIPAVVIDYKVKPSGRTVDSWAVIPYEVWKKVIHGIANDQGP